MPPLPKKNPRLSSKHDAVRLDNDASATALSDISNQEKKPSRRRKHASFANIPVEVFMEVNRAQRMLTPRR